MSIVHALRAFWKALRQPQDVKETLQAPLKKEEGHLQLLALLQGSGRLLDFLKEDIAPYSDEQVGSAVRKIHADCSKALEEWVTVRPLLEQQEGETIQLQEGYDPAQFHLVGKIKESPPYCGIVRHRGWKAHKLSLPQTVLTTHKEVLCPAEVELP